MVARCLALWMFPLVVGAYIPMCAPVVAPTMPPLGGVTDELWDEPEDLADRDLFSGPWGSSYAPDPDDAYTLVGPKEGGINPGVVVRDSKGRRWRVKQAPLSASQGDEGPVEVVLSRVLSGLGYHQPPVYYLRSFRMAGPKPRNERGGRFRLDVDWLQDRGSWSWQQNPFVGTRPYNGLLVILLMFNSSDLKNSNNTLYDVVRHETVERRYVVRDLGAALGKTGRFWPIRNDITRFERTLFIRGIVDGYVEFDYGGFHQELVRRRVTPADVAWASALAGRLSLQQWQDAFRAGGYEPEVASRFIAILRDRLAQARLLAGGGTPQQNGGV